MPMRSGTIMLILLLLTLTACKKQEAGVSGFPVKSFPDKTWQIVATDGNPLIFGYFDTPPSVVINGIFSLADSGGMYRLYSISDSIVQRLSGDFVQMGHFFEEVTIAQKEFNTPLLIINRKAETVVRLSEHILMAHNFKDGVALVYTDKQKYGYIDVRGEAIIQPIYDCAYDFCDGLAIVGTTNNQGQTAYRAINRKGETVFPVTLQNSRINGMFSDGRLLFKNLQQNRCGYLDKTGKTALLLPENIQEASDFKFGMALILTSDGYGVIHLSGKIIIPPHFEEARIVAPHRIALRLNNRWALFDANGQSISEFIYNHISDFSTNNRTFATCDSLYLTINNRGEVIDTCRFSLINMDETATGSTPQVFTLHAPAVDPEPEVTEEIDTVSESLPVRKVLIGQNNPFYAEMQKVINGQLPETDVRNRKIILEYMERFRSSYILKNIDFLEQLFSEDALIIVGRVIQKSPTQGSRYLSSEQIVYNLKSKKEYLHRLREVFAKNGEINVRFRDFGIRKHPTVKGMYGVTVRQHYSSDLYSDEGYLFLLWDFRNESMPQLHVRTWQPRMLDENTPLPEQEIFSIRNFNIE